ncbi:hypothetical protein [Microbacterium sp.]|uniref:hypothetical protein n=1 Tax=Microbacterium sp. TaxID=51671 RepID=UPI0039E6E4A9
MDLAWAVEFWWIGPIVIGTGTLGWLGLRHERAERLRRVELEAARQELKAARRDAASARAAVRVARTELVRLQAERAAHRATPADVAGARHALDTAQRETRAASATVRAHRARVSAARAALPAGAADPAALPLARLMSGHDAVTARWMAYETDPARLIAFPAMTDARVPATATFLAEQRTTWQLRPASARVRLTTAQFAAYRDSVARLGRAFDAAEAEAWRRARAEGSAPPVPTRGDPDAAAAPTTDWAAFAQSLTQTVIVRSAEALARVAAPPASDAAAGPTPSPRPQPAPSPQARPDGRVWPVPARDSRSARP